MIYFTSDTHFFDSRLNLFPRYFGNVEEMNTHLIKKWNETVSPDDTVYHLGDFSYTLQGLDVAHKLNGRKHLIIGNYDEKHGVEKLTPYFDSVNHSLDITIQDEDDQLDVHLVHYPSKGVSKRFNLVGHIHGNWRVQKNMLNVGVDVWHFQPITAKEVLFFYNAICKFYDHDVWVSNINANLKYNYRGNIPKHPIYSCPICGQDSLCHTLITSFCSNCNFESST